LAKPQQQAELAATMQPTDAERAVMLLRLQLYAAAQRLHGEQLDALKELVREIVMVLDLDVGVPMSPAAGQGASLALEDAMLLGHLLSREAATAGDAFAELERRRRKRVESIASTARDNDERSLKSLGSFACWMRDRLFPLFAPLVARALDKQYAVQVV
jgi:hypothetical protein